MDTQRDQPRAQRLDESPELARRSKRFWVNLQTRYDLEVEKDRLGSALDDIRPLSAAS